MTKKQALKNNVAKIKKMANLNPLLDVSTRGKSQWYMQNKMRSPIDRMKFEQNMKAYEFDPKM